MKDKSRKRRNKAEKIKKRTQCQDAHCSRILVTVIRVEDQRNPTSSGGECSAMFTWNQVCNQLFTGAEQKSADAESSGVSG